MVRQCVYQINFRIVVLINLLQTEVCAYIGLPIEAWRHIYTSVNEDIARADDGLSPLPAPILS